MDELQRLAGKLEELLRAQGMDQFEYSVTESEKRELNTEKDDFNLYRTLFSHSASVTVLREGKKGSASGNDLSEEGLWNLVESAAQGADSAMADEANAIAERQDPAVFESGVREADMGKLYDSVKAMLDTAGKEYPRASVLQVIAEHVARRTLYANSSGTRFDHRDGAYSVSMEMSGSDGEMNTGLDYVEITTHDLDTPLIDQGAIRRHLQDVEGSLHQTRIPGKFEGTVIFTPDCVGYFLYMLAQNYLMSSVVMEGTSQWLERLEQQVASEKITVSLKAEDDRIACLSPWTGDGYRAENVTVIEKGVLKTFLLNLYAARKTGRPVTKNSGFGVVMEPGDASLQEMIAGVDRGLIVGGFSGGQPGANGEFSGVAKNSFYVEKGKISGAVTETMINGNLEQVFKNVAAVSREQVRDGSSVLPWLAAEGIVISGK